MTGTAEKMQFILQELQKVFGELKVEWHVFTNCGVRHAQDIKTKEIVLDQIQFASQLHPIAHPQLTGGRAEDESSPELHQLFMSLLGAVAYLSLTRMDILVFISALQRHMAKSTFDHVRKLNKLLRWVQKHPYKLHYKRLTSGSGDTEGGSPGTHLRIVSDAAYKRETEEGFSLRGAVFCRGPGQQLSGAFTAIHVLDYICKSQRHVTRSTFSAELLAAGDAIDQGVLVSHMLCELEEGVMTPGQARLRYMEGGFVPMSLCVDAKSVFAAVTATFIKTPAEKSLLCHIQYLRQQLDRKVLTSLLWLDTRDMGADGLTKGAVSREALQELMRGEMHIRHPSESWESKGAASDKYHLVPGSQEHNSRHGGKLWWKGWP